MVFLDVSQQPDPAVDASCSGAGEDSVGGGSWEPVLPFERAAVAARDELGEILGRINAAQADLLALTDRVIGDELWAVAGIRSVEHWLTCFAGVSPSRAGDLVRICRRSTDLPRMRASVREGRLTLDQATVVARHTPATHDAEVDQFAPSATVTQLRRALCKYTFPEPDPQPEPAPETEPESASDPGPDTEAESTPGPEPESGTQSDMPGSAFGVGDPDPLDPVNAPTSVRMGYRDGRFHLEVGAPAQIGALLEQALKEAKDAIFRAGQQPASLGAALEEIATRSLTFAGQVTSSRADKYRVYLHLDTDHTGWLQQRGALPAHVLDRLTCQGILQPVWHTGGAPVNVGRAQHIVPERTRRLVEDRDRGCRYPGCVSLYHLEVHHLRHWRDGGLTDLDNLICLCGHHHDAHHRGEFQISGDPNRRGGPGALVFTTRTGAPIGPLHPATEHEPATPAPARREQPATTPRRYIGPTGEHLHTRWVDFGPGTPAGTRPDTSREPPDQPTTEPPPTDPTTANPPDNTEPIKPFAWMRTG